MLTHHGTCFYADPFSGPHFQNSFQDIKEKASSVFYAAAVLVRPAIGCLVQKLLNQVDKPSLDLNPVKTSVFSELCGRPVVSDRLPDIRKASFHPESHS